MNEMQQVAYIMAQAACAQVEAIGMAQENAVDVANGRPPTYAIIDFNMLMEKYGIHHNAVIAFFNQGR